MYKWGKEKVHGDAFVFGVWEGKYTMRANEEHRNLSQFNHY